MSVGAGKRGSRDADDREGALVERHRRANACGSAPNCRRQYSSVITADSGPPGCSSSARQQPADAGGRAEHAEVTGRDPRRRGVVGRAVHRHAGFAARVIRQAPRSSGSARASRESPVLTRWCCARRSSDCVLVTTTMRSGASNGSGRSTTALTTLKMAVVAPMPSASVRIAVAAKPGCRIRRSKAVAHVLQQVVHADFDETDVGEG